MEKGIIDQRIEALRKVMKDRGVLAYIIPTGDDHMCEYLCDHFMERKYMSGFTGSAGTLVVTSDKAGLWTDGRYHLQAGEQLKGTCIELFKAGRKGVATIKEYLTDAVQKAKDDGETDVKVGVPGNMISADYGISLEESLAECGAELLYRDDLVDLVWEDRPGKPESRVWVLGNEYTGEDASSKIKRVRDTLKDGETLVVCDLPETAWLFNIRADDVLYTPVKLAFTVLDKEKALVYTDLPEGNDDIRTYLSGLGAEVRPYDDFYKDIAGLPGRAVVDKLYANYKLYRLLKETGEVEFRKSDITEFKAIKNDTEAENLISCHVDDGAALTKFIYYMKHTDNVETEISAADKLEAFRRQTPDLFELSFDSICGFADHGAIIHYGATPETDVTIEKRSMLLIDSGGQYLRGTTDVTRTFAMGEVTPEMKKHYTAVMQGTLRLMNAKFPEGTPGSLLDGIVRSPVWAINCDYMHGTGHGIGFCLGVHEDPVRIPGPPTEDAWTFKAGAVVSDEPGIYIDGEYGIRIENQLLCVKCGDGLFGDMLGFRCLTMAPMDMDLVDLDMLNSDDLRMLRDYQNTVYEALKDRLNDDEREWLKSQTEF
ncbi:MAG: aminopeptidase P family protein [Lachnospiraceae bacterium]|nr:aminopeptidase P family protein [Lachnospiraceae bacterium]